MGLNRQLRAETRLSVYFILFLATGTGGFGGEVGAIVDLLSKSTRADNESTTKRVLIKKKGFSFSADVLY